MVVEPRTVKVNGTPQRTIWTEGDAVCVLDQTQLPHAVAIRRLETLEHAATAIADMWIRGAPLVGVTAAYGVALAMRRDASDAGLAQALAVLGRTRPTAVNLQAKLDEMRVGLAPLPPGERALRAAALAADMADEDVRVNTALGAFGLAILEAIAQKKGRVEVLTHCNAGWLATVDRGTATAPLYAAQAAGIPLHVWVDETRPRNQGASLTAWELGEQGIEHTVLVDNAGGHVMQAGRVDVVLVGTDRTTRDGDVCNKIGTYLKALAARDNDIPFYVALPSSSIDWDIDARAIPIEERDGREVSHVSGLTDDGRTETVRVTPRASRVHNPGFDVTPARLVTGLITERGVAEASRAGLSRLFPEHAS